MRGTGQRYAEGTITGFGAECEHGHLRRKCPICDRDEDIARLTAERDDALRLVKMYRNDAGVSVRMANERSIERDEAREERDNWMRTCDQRDAESEAEILKLRDDLLTATRERNEARAEVERLRTEVARAGQRATAEALARGVPSVQVEALREVMKMIEDEEGIVSKLIYVCWLDNLIDQHTGEGGDESN